MRTTVTIDDNLYSEVSAYMPEASPRELFESVLKDYLRQRAYERLIAFGGSDPDADIPPRRSPHGAD
jgi:Arc/MetJ family transcription regulator